MGKDYLVNGMTIEQMIYFYNCCTVVESTSIDYQTMAFGRVMTDEKGQKSINKTLDDMRSTLTKHLLRL